MAEGEKQLQENLKNLLILEQGKDESSLTHEQANRNIG